MTPTQQQIEELAVKVQKLKSEQLILQQKIQANVNKLETQNIDSIVQKYMIDIQQPSTNEYERINNSNQSLKQADTQQHWSFSEKHNNNSSQIRQTNDIFNQQICNYNISENHQNQQSTTDSHLNSQFLQKDNPQIKYQDNNQMKNIHYEVFSNEKDSTNKNIIQGFTHFGQDQSYQQLNTQESNSMFSQSYELQNMQEIANTTNTTTHAASQQEIFSPKNGIKQKQLDEYIKNNTPIKEYKQDNLFKNQINQGNESQIQQTYDNNCILQNQIKQQNSTIKQDHMENQISEDNNILFNKLQNYVKELKLVLSEQCQQIKVYQEIISSKDELIKKQSEIEESMKKITQGLLDQLKQSKQQVGNLNQQKEEAYSLLFSLEEEYKKIQIELNQKKNQTKYILNENIQLERIIAELKRDNEMKIEEKYNSNYNQNYQGQIDSLLQIIQQYQITDKENNNSQIFGNIQKQLTSQIRQINESEFKLQELRKQNKKYKQKLHKIGLKYMQNIIINKQKSLLQQLFIQYKQSCNINALKH